MANSSSSDSNLDKSAGVKSGKDGLTELLAAGSTALLSDAPKDAAEKYKTVLSKMNKKANQKLPIVQLVIRYALCIAWIKTSNYEHIVQAIESLRELITFGFYNKLPALYLALARAYFLLNRFKAALASVEKGLKLLGNNSEIKQFTWPGLHQKIEETEKSFLLKEFLSLKEDCDKDHPPDATCGYNECVENSKHPIPSPEIYFTDPSFHPFYYLKCDASCELAYHNSCWKQVKNSEHPKDLLGTPCISGKCMADINTPSIIVEVQLIGRDGFDKPIQTWQLNGSKFEALPGKFNNSSSLESSNGSVDKCCLSARQEKSAITPACEAQVSSFKQRGNHEDSQGKVASASTYPITHASNLNFVGPPIVCTFPAAPDHDPGLTLHYPVRNVGHSADIPLARVPFYPPSPNVPLNFPAALQSRFLHATRPLSPVSFWPNAWPPIRMPQQGYVLHPVSAQKSSQFVEVVVRSPAHLEAGTTLYVPIGPTGGQVQIKPVSYPKQDGSSTVQSTNCKVSELQKSSPLSLVESDGQPLEVSPPSQTDLKSTLFSASPASKIQTPEQGHVALDFKRQVHELAKDNVEKVQKSSDSTVQVKRVHDVNMNYEEPELLKVTAMAYGTPMSSSSTSLTNNSMDEANFPSVDTYLNFIPSPDHLMTQASTFQAKLKSSPSKEVQHHIDQPSLTSSASSLCSSQDDVRTEPYDNDHFQNLLEALNKCRSIKFGYLDDDVNPELQCFGHPFIEDSAYVETHEIDKADADSADFVFSYYYSMFANNGPYQIDDLQETWKNDLFPETFTVKYPSISDFLLKSKKFAAIDDLIGTSDLLPDMFSKAEKELSESISYLLFSQVVKPRIKEERSVPDTSFNSQKYCNDSIHPSSSSRLCTSRSSIDMDESALIPPKQHSDGLQTSGPVFTGNRDNNDNPISSSVSVNFNNLVTTAAVNGRLKPTSESFVPQGSNNSKKKLDYVYMSDDDEEMEVTLGDIDNEKHSLGHQTANEELGTWFSEHTQCWFQDQSIQTDQVFDTEKASLVDEKEFLQKDVSELKYEKAELHQRVESLQRQMESSRQSLKQMQEKLEGKLQKKTDRVKELEEKTSALEQELNGFRDQVTEKENQLAELRSLEKELRRSHAKEINHLNNFVKNQLAEKQKKEDEIKEFQSMLQCNIQNSMKLWKEFCEFKINKFNHICNDRINVLSQLRDMMSDNISPTKSDIKSTIEKYEELMISVTKKNAEVNDVYNREMERLRNGMAPQLLSVIDVPDIMTMHYPPEGAFEYLLKPKQEEFGVPQNQYSPFSSSRFYPRQLGSNNTQPMNQLRENEGFSSLFSQGPSETSHLWNNVFSSSSATHTAMPFNVGTNGPNISMHQGFNSPSPLLSQQPTLNMVPNVMSYQTTSSQNASAKGVIGQTRATPSPSLPFSMNGPLFNNNSSASAGTKTPIFNAVQKPIPSTVPLSPVQKTTPQVVSASTTSSAVLGAISKPRVQTATASMTPIVPSKAVRFIPKTSSTNESNYEKLMRSLQKMFPTRNDVDLTQALKMAREKNGNSLSSLTHSEIVAKVEEILSKHFRKQTSIGWEKFGQAAWGTATAKQNVVEWKGSEQDECCICMNSMNAQEVYTLECKHAFHKECIRKWLTQDSVCPNCRKHSTMLDEFPPLG